MMQLFIAYLPQKNRRSCPQSGQRRRTLEWMRQMQHLTHPSFHSPPASNGFRDRNIRRDKYSLFILPAGETFPKIQPDLCVVDDTGRQTTDSPLFRFSRPAIYDIYIENKDFVLQRSFFVISRTRQFVDPCIGNTVYSEKSISSGRMSEGTMQSAVSSVVRITNNSS